MTDWGRNERDALLKRTMEGEREKRRKGEEKSRSRKKRQGEVVVVIAANPGETRAG